MAKIRMEENKQEDDFSKLCGNIISGTISIFLLILVTVFPLILHNSYVDVLKTKYQCYYITILGMLAIILVLVVIMFFVDWKEYHGKHMLRLCTRLHPGNWKSTFCLADIAVIAFWLTLLVSTFQSKYFYESFWGNEGRFTGLFLHLIYIAGFFVISRLYRFKGWHLYIFLAVAMLPLLFGITDYFRLDLLGFKENVAAEDVDAFTSTFGNINTYITFIGILFGALSALFVMEDKGWKAVLSFAGYMITVVAMIMSNSENGILAAAFIFVFLPLFAFRYMRGIERYLLLLSGFFASCYVVSWINKNVDMPLVALDGVCHILANLSFALPNALLFGSLALAVYFLRLRADK